jgi:biotin operon repressor
LEYLSEGISLNDINPNKMDIEELLNHLETLDQFVQNKCTGSPQELAEKLGVSENSVYELLKIIETFGYPLKFNHELDSYEYVKPCKLRLLDFEEILVKNTNQYLN